MERNKVHAGFVMIVKNADSDAIGYVKSIDFFRCQVVEKLTDATIFEAKDKDRILEYWNGEDGCGKDWIKKIKATGLKDFEVKLTPIYCELGLSYN